jgi:hypothetical protein
MPIPAFRAKQSTDTDGTGTLVLNAAATNARSFNAAFGASARRIMYCISWSTGFEIGYGDFDGGTPGSLTRATVLASSNAGSLVTLPAGTKDVFAVFEPAAREVVAISGTATLALADLGNTVVFSGASAATLNLPAVATVPNGAGWLVMNRGTAALTIDPNGAEQVNGASTLVLQAGQAAMILRVSGAWQAALLGSTAIGAALQAALNGAAAADVLSAAPVDIASAATTDIGSATSPNVRVTGTTTITSLGTAPAGVRRFLTFAAVLTITYNATSLQTPGLANITTAAGDTAVARSLGSGNWVIESFTRAAGLPMSASATGAALVAAADAAAARTVIGVSDQWVQLSSTAITAVSAIDLTWTGGAYLAYKIFILGLKPGASTANNLFLRVRRNGSFLSGASDYNTANTWWAGTSGFTSATAENLTTLCADGVFAEPVFAEVTLMQAATAERIVVSVQSRHTNNTPAHTRSWFTANTGAGSGWLDGATISFVGSATNFAAVGRIVVLGMKS